MTVKEFRQTYCSLCGTQRCLGTEEDISYCGYYHGEIEGLPKNKSAYELLEEIMRRRGITWDDIRKNLRDKGL